LISTSSDEELEADDKSESSTLDDADDAEADEDNDRDADEEDDEINGIFDSRDRRVVVCLGFESRMGR
jgi:hypothetical protein